MDDAHIIYDKRSGHSQALNDFAREIFDIIEDKPRNLPEILAALELILERPIEDDLKQQILQTVTEFDKMGLIEPVNLHNENI
ncbi:MAG: HPr-rel-A system PqqD family peptide chaperone [Emcibacter sp.]|nr:HPr-rel-A system PqqD family peptide chaperone [Emcibacter sp.]